MSTDTTTSSTIFPLDGHLLALHADALALAIPYHARGKSRADWIIGVKQVSDAQSVHGDHWERHPRGDETLCLLEGSIELVLQTDTGSERSIALQAGQACIVARGTWHRLQVHAPGRLLFVTPSIGSEHRKVGGAA